MLLIFFSLNVLQIFLSQSCLLLLGERIQNVESESFTHSTSRCLFSTFLCYSSFPFAFISILIFLGGIVYVNEQVALKKKCDITRKTKGELENPSFLKLSLSQVQLSHTHTHKHKKTCCTERKTKDNEKKILHK